MDGLIYWLIAVQEVACHQKKIRTFQSLRGIPFHGERLSGWFSAKGARPDRLIRFFGIDRTLHQGTTIGFECDQYPVTVAGEDVW